MRENNTKTGHRYNHIIMITVIISLSHS